MGLSTKGPDGPQTGRKKGGVIIGFRERGKPYITNSHICPVLDERVGLRLESLREAIDRLSISGRVPQVEISATDNVVTLVLRHLEPLNPDDLEILRGYGAEQDFEIYLQPGGPDSVHHINGRDVLLDYRLNDVTLSFLPSDFTQVNARINQKMVARAIELLALQNEDVLADMFCGIGNFSLPAARHAGEVLGVEGDAGLVERAQRNAQANGITNARFETANLADPEMLAGLSLVSANKLLLDPPRSGAIELLANLPLSNIGRIVYVSCNPVTFARDAALLVNEGGFELVETGILDMFPQTAHVESLSLFVRAR